MSASHDRRPAGAGRVGIWVPVLCVLASVLMVRQVRLRRDSVTRLPVRTPRPAGPPRGRHGLQDPIPGAQLKVGACTRG